MVLLIKENNEWKQITKEEKKLLPPEERIKVLYIDGKQKEKLDYALSQQAKDNDGVIIIGGNEGSGKSAMGGNTMRYVSKDNFDPKRDMIGSDFDDGIQKIQNVKKGGCLMFDEGNVFFLSTEVMKKEQRDLHKIFSIFRQKNLIVVIVIPSFFRLSSYFALDRSRILMQTYIKDGERGFFSYFGDNRKKQLWYKGKRDYNMQAVKPNFRGRFEDCYLLKTEDYQSFKMNTLMSSIKTAKVQKIPSKSELVQGIKLDVIRDSMDYSANDIADILKISVRRVDQLRKEVKDNEISRDYTE